MGMSVGALAEGKFSGGTGSTNNQTEVEYNLTETWLITIPAKITLDISGSHSSEQIAVTEAHISDGNELKISATSKNSGYLAIENSKKEAKIPYTLNSQSLTVKTDILTVADDLSGETTKTLEFNATIAQAKAAGDYTDTITFEAVSELAGE